jgi:adenylate cyclase
VARGKIQRRLAAILAADVVGYSRLVARDEEGALAKFAAHMGELVEPRLGEHGGRIIKRMGDGVLVEFTSVVDALRAAMAIQQGMRERNIAEHEDQRMEFRVGIHVADVVVEGDDVFGDGVNLASRLEGIAEPGGICVSARVQEDAQGRLDAVFEDAGEQHLKNLPRPVRVFRVRDGARDPDERPALPLPSKPSIAVLPFLNMSDDPEQEYFADAISEDLTTALSRWRWFFVIARNSSFAYKGRALDMKRIARELGVRYLLEGSVRKVGERVRVTVQLIDAADASHIWADRFDRDLVDILALQDEITEMVAAAIEPAMQRSEALVSGRKNLRDYTALDCFQRGMWHFNKVSLDGYREALTLFRESILRDPQLPHGHIGLSRTLYAGATFYGWSHQPEADLAEALAEAQAAIELDARDAYAYYAFAGAALYLGRHDEALDAARRTVALNPSFALGHSRLAQVLIYIGRPADAIASVERSLRHNPYDPQLGAMLGLLALAQYQARNYADAIEPARGAIQHGYKAGYVLLACALACMGQVEEARRVFPAELIERTGRDTPRLVPYANTADRDHLLQGMQRAGLMPAPAPTPAVVES